MAATLIGRTGIWGVNSDETGMIVESLDFEAKNSEKATKNKSGESIGFSFYDKMMDVSLKGQLLGGFAPHLAGSLALANTAPFGITGTNIIKSGMKLGMAIEDFQKIDVPSTFYPLV